MLPVACCRPLLRWLPLAVALSLSLGGCDDQPSAPAAADAGAKPDAPPPAPITLPDQVGQFHRTDILRRDQDRDVTAGYRFGDGPGMIVATVRMHPETGADLAPLIGGKAIADTDASAAALEQSITQVRHYYPTATLTNVRPVYMVKQGELQGGRAATLRYNDVIGGERTNIDLDVYVFCCIDEHRAYEYRIRHAADTDAGRLALSFMRGVDWTAPPPVSSADSK